MWARSLTRIGICKPPFFKNQILNLIVCNLNWDVDVFFMILCGTSLWLGMNPPFFCSATQFCLPPNACCSSKSPWPSPHYTSIPSCLTSRAPHYTVWLYKPYKHEELSRVEAVVVDVAVVVFTIIVVLFVVTSFKTKNNYVVCSVLTPTEKTSSHLILYFAHILSTLHPMCPFSSTAHLLISFTRIGQVIIRQSSDEHK